MRAPTELQDQPPHTPMRGVSFCANAPVHKKYIHPLSRGKGTHGHHVSTQEAASPPSTLHPSDIFHVPCSTLAPSAAFPSPPHFRVVYMKPMDDDERFLDLH